MVGVSRKGQQLEDNILYDCDVLPDGSIVACGVAQYNNATFPQQAWLLRVDADGCMESDPQRVSGLWCENTEIREVSPQNDHAFVTVYPNPANELIIIDFSSSSEDNDELRLEILNELGQTIHEQKLSFYSPPPRGLTLLAILPGLHCLYKTQLSGRSDFKVCEAIGGY